MAGVRPVVCAMTPWYVAGVTVRPSAGHHHATVHARVERARVAVLARPFEPVGERALGLVLGDEAVALHVVGDRAVVEAPGDLGARRHLDRRRLEPEVLGDHLGDAGDAGPPRLLQAGQATA